MERKEFLRLSAFTAVAVSLPVLHSCNSSTAGSATTQPIFLSRLFDKNTIINAGKSYLEQKPAENNGDTLVKLLADNNPIAGSADEKAIQQFLDEKVRMDFEKGNTVMVKGWVLAVTEARQCALFSIMNS